MLQLVPHHTRGSIGNRSGVKRLGGPGGHLALDGYPPFRLGEKVRESPIALDVA